jgi:Spy/CpxP family protein refolding chaperone
MKTNLIQYATVAALAAGMAFAQTPAPQPPSGGTGNGATMMPRRARARRRMLQALNLTDAQKAQAKTIFQQARQSNQPLRQQLQQNRAALSAAVKAGDSAQIQQLAAAQGQIVGKMTAVRTQAMANLYATLTPDQRAKADQIQQRIRTRTQQRASQRGNG